MGIHLHASIRSASSAAFSSPSFSVDNRVSRRGRITRGVLSTLALVLVALPIAALAQQSADLTERDHRFLDEVQERAVLFFIEHTDAATGLTHDRAPKDGRASKAPASIAASGFALSAWCIADARGWLPPGEARERTVRALRFIADEVENERGWYYHFVDTKTGARAWRSEASTIDTALFLKGALQAREYLRDPEVSALVEKIYARIDWQWALNDGKTLSHGWKPESGFIRWRWDSYSELMGLYLLGMGSPNHPLPASSWDAWSRGPVSKFEDRTFLQGGPLFTHQYAQAWFDFRGQRDAYTDYWQNSIDATLAQRAWFAAQSKKYPHWSSDMWGLTASDSARGYKAWGTPGHANGSADGTLVPCAPGGSLPFAPRECLTALEKMREFGGEAVWGRYGFADAFNPQTGWSSPDVIAIDVGITLVMAENLRSGMIWETFMRAPEVQRGMKLAGFHLSRQPDPTLAHVE